MDKPKRLNVNLSIKRFEKLKEYAQSREKTLTQTIEEWIDRLPKNTGG